VYEKGAEVIRMQYTLLGPAQFRRGIDLYFQRHDGHAVTCDDFVQAMQDASGFDLTQFKRWYSQAGTPVVTATGIFDAAQSTYTLDVSQDIAATPGQPSKLPLHIPLALGLVGPDGRDIPLRLDGEATASGETRVLHLRQQAQTFRFVDVPARPVPSLLRGFSAPATLEFAYTDADLALLAAHDSDAVNRWDAAQRIFARTMLVLAADHRNHRALVAPPVLVDVVRSLLDDRSSDPALIALAVTLPDVAYVAALTETIDVDGVDAASRFLVRELARLLRHEMEDAYARHRGTARDAPPSKQSGARKLANTCLRYLCSVADAKARAAAMAQFDAADNMTDSVAALAALRDDDTKERRSLFERFEARWRDEPLVLDKWFALEATSARGDTLQRVRGLLAHPRFNAKNPNRVRSLVGAFALRNFARFHDRDGAGYEFAADEVLALDPTNPQLAAAIAGAFNLWKRFPEPRRGLMQAALQRIAAAPGLSPDVTEVVTRTLAG